MKLFFMGTGAAEGIPALFCDCAICQQAKQRGEKNIRSRATVLVDDTVKIDFPPETLAHVHQYPRINFAALEHLLFTHSHDDHFAVRELQYLSPSFAPSRREPLHVWATEPLLRFIHRKTEQFFEPPPLQCHTLRPFEEVIVGSRLAVTPVVSNHREDEVCLNFLLRSIPEGKTLLYATDTGWYDPPAWAFLLAQNLDAVVMECGKGISQSAYEGHLSVEEVIKVREKLLAGGALVQETPFYLTHISHTGLLLHEEMESLVAPHGIKVAFDGLEITL